MIRLQLISKEPYFDLNMEFSRLISGFDGPEEPAFRDEESRKILWELGRYRIVEDEFYALLGEDGTRTATAAVEKEIRYALCLIAASRKGEYTPIESLKKEQWELLKSMPFDILLSEYITNLGYYKNRVYHPELLIENYPFDGKTIPVHLLDAGNIAGNPAYRKVREGKTCEPVCCLYQGKDGEYYLEDSQAFCDSLQYHWQNDLENILSYIDGMKQENVYIVEPSQEYTLESLAESIYRQSHEEGNETPFWGMGEDTWERYLEKLPQEALDLKIISHIFEMPVLERIVHRHGMICHDKTAHDRYAVLTAEQDKNGGWKLCGESMDPFDTFEKIIYRAAGMDMQETLNRWYLAVRAPYILSEPSDLKNTIFGYHRSPDSLEFWDGVWAAKEFGTALRQARDSGNYTARQILQ